MKMFPYKKLLFVMLILLLVVSTAVFARAGGGGGSSRSGGGGGDGIGFLIYLIIRLVISLPFPLNLIVVGITIAGFFLYVRAKQKQSFYDKMPAGNAFGNKQSPGLNAFLKNNQAFEMEAFLSKAKKAFIKIQKAWEAQDISPVRRWISDGVYQRFNTQFKMMKLLKQKNTLDGLTVKTAVIDKVTSDGLFDIIHVAIHAEIVDRFISDIDPGLNSGGKEEFVEYWSFMKKRDSKTTDMYESGNCPNCANPLPEDLGELSKCAYCGTITNSGEYDWVLSEITQADDYAASHPRVSRHPGLKAKTTKLVETEPDFSVQGLEDKVSNGYLQVISAMALRKPENMRRFVSNEAYAKLEKRLPPRTMAYSRIYLNDVTLIGVQEKNEHYILPVSVKLSFQRVLLGEKSVEKVDQAVITANEVVMMKRKKHPVSPKGNLYAHSCPGCGAQLKDTLDTKCAYCGSLLNSPETEWIIDDILSVPEYEQYFTQLKNEFIYTVKPATLEKLYKVKDYALNNIMVMAAADGVFDARELEFARQIAKKIGFNVNKLDQLFDMAKNGRLSVRMPENGEQRNKIIAIMEKAAYADEEFSTKERELLDAVKQRYAGTSA